jgi:hypothetical protein
MLNLLNMARTSRTSSYRNSKRSNVVAEGRNQGDAEGLPVVPWTSCATSCAFGGETSSRRTSAVSAAVVSSSPGIVRNTGLPAAAKSRKRTEFPLLLVLLLLVPCLLRIRIDCPVLPGTDSPGRPERPEIPDCPALPVPFPSRPESRPDILLPPLFAADARWYGLLARTEGARGKGGTEKRTDRLGRRDDFGDVVSSRARSMVEVPWLFLIPGVLSMWSGGTEKKADRLAGGDDGLEPMPPDDGLEPIPAHRPPEGGR